MKNKKLIYILIPLLILIWGTIFYKLFFNTPPPENWSEDEINPQKIIPVAALQDTFTIHADYRDPFLGTVVFSTNIPMEPNTKKLLPLPRVEPVTQWPNIVYGGMIKNQQSTKQLALLKINGKESILREGEMAETIELQKIYKDSVEVKMGKIRKIVLK